MFMLCRLALRRVIHLDENQTEYVLRVAGEHALGSAGNLGTDERSFSTEKEFVLCLRSLGVSDATVSKAEVTARLPASAKRFVGFADCEQIAFTRLQDANFDVFAD